MSTTNVTVKVRSAPIKVNVVGGVGARGLSNYEVYLATDPDPVLSEEDWLLTQVSTVAGPTGPTGPIGPTGPGGGGASVTISDTPPANPVNGAQWKDSTDGTTSTWDSTALAWIEND